MIRKTIPIISQSSVELLDAAKISHNIAASNSIYFTRYPYKVVFNPVFDSNKPWEYQITDFSMDLTGFAEDMLTDPTRKYLVSQDPIMYLSSYSDLLTTLAVYGNIISRVYGPVSTEHLDLLFSPNFCCEAKKKLWYNMYDCKVESWTPIRSRINGNDTSSVGLDSFLKEQINMYMPMKNWLFNQYNFTAYCNFDEFVAVLPFAKMAYPDNILNITKAVVKG